MNRINWLYFLKDKTNPKNVMEIFLYGLSLPTEFNKKEEFKTKGVELNSKKEIVIYQYVGELKLLPENKINFNEICPHMRTIRESSIITKKTVIQIFNDFNQRIPESLVKSPMSVDVYYTGDFSSYNEQFYFKDSNLKELAELTQKLEYETGLLFYSGAYSKRLGCFEHGTPQLWSEKTETPFTLEISSNKLLFNRELKFEEFIIGDLTLHLIAYDKEHEIVLDQIFLINGKEPQYSFDISITMDGNLSYEYWVFNDKGKLIDRNCRTYIEKCHIDRNINTNRYVLSAGNFSNKSALKNEDLEVNIGYRDTIVANLVNGTQNIILKYMDYLYQKLKKYSVNEGKDGQWFKKQINGKELVNYLNKITRGDNCEMTVVDPYITVRSLDYLLTLENIELKLKFISCKQKINPDTNEQYTKEEKDTVTRLKNYKNYQVPLNNLKWHVFNGGKFHDRFIYIKNTQEHYDKSDQVYLLSNSLNGMLINYDWCIVPLQGQTKIMALEYIASLEKDLNESTLIYPNDK